MREEHLMHVLLVLDLQTLQTHILISQQFEHQLFLHTHKIYLFFSHKVSIELESFGFELKTANRKSCSVIGGTTFPTKRVELSGSSVVGI